MARKMNRLCAGVLLAALVSTSAWAMPSSIDTDGDGLATLTELQVAYPDLTEELFLEIDIDEDGFIDDEEMVAAVSAELIAEPEVDQ